MVVVGLEGVLRLCGEDIIWQNNSLYQWAIERRITWDIAGHTNLLGQHNRATQIRIPHSRAAPSLRPYQTIYAVKPLEGVERVVLLGRSSIEGGGGVSSGKQTVGPMLQDIFAAEGLRVEVINAGVGGFDIFQVAVQFDEVLARLGPRAVVFYLGKSYGNVRVVESVEIYDRMSRCAAMHPFWLRTPRDLWVAADLDNPNLITATLQQMMEPFHLYHLMRFMVSWHAWSRRPELRKAYYSVVEQSIRRIAEATQRIGAALFIVPEIYAAPIRAPFPISDELIRSVLAPFSKAKLVRVDGYFPEGDKRQRLFFDDVHPYPAGNALLAKAFAEMLRAELR